MRSMIIALAFAAGFAPALASACPMMEQKAAKPTQTVMEDSKEKGTKG